MTDKTKLPEPIDLDEAKSQIATLISGLDASQERVGQLEDNQKSWDANSKKTEAELKTAEETVVDLGKKLEVAEESNTEFQGQIKTLQENNDAAGKDMAEAAEKIAEANDLKEANATLTKERDEALDKLDISEKDLAKAEKLTKGEAADRKKENEAKKALNVKFAYVFKSDPGYASMVLCGIQVEPDEDGIWMLTKPQFKEAVGHGVEPQRAQAGE